MTYRQTMRRVVLPQAFRVIIPPTGNEFIAMIKDTALVCFLGTTVATEIFRRAQLVGKADFRNLEALHRRGAALLGADRVFTFFQPRLETRLEQGLRPRHLGASQSQGQPRPWAGHATSPEPSAIVRVDGPYK